MCSIVPSTKNPYSLLLNKYSTFTAGFPQWKSLCSVGKVSAQLFWRGIAGSEFSLLVVVPDWCDHAAHDMAWASVLGVLWESQPTLMGHLEVVWCHAKTLSLYENDFRLVFIPVHSICYMDITWLALIIPIIILYWSRCLLIMYQIPTDSLPCLMTFLSWSNFSISIKIYSNHMSTEMLCRAA